MAVQTEITSVQYSGNGSTSTPYPITFPYLDVEHIKVDVDGVVLTGGYTITGDGATISGQLTTDTAYTSDQLVTVYRDVPETQEYRYVDGVRIPAPVLEQNQDLQLMQIQQTSATARRSIRFSVKDGQVPEINLVPNTTIVVDALGNPSVKTAAEMIDHIGVQASVDAAAASAASASSSETNSQANRNATEAYAAEVASYQNLLQLRIGGYLELRTA